MINNKLFFVSILLCIGSFSGCATSKLSKSKNIDLFDIYYDKFALESTTRQNPPVSEERFLTALKANHLAIKHLKAHSPMLDKVHRRIKEKGCNLGRLRDSVAIYIKGTNFTEPLFIYKEGYVVVNKNICSVHKEESDQILRELGLKAYWLGKIEKE